MEQKPLTPEAVHLLTRIGMQSNEMQKRNMDLARDVTRARDAGASWRMISVALGVTTQAAWQKYRPVAASTWVSQGDLFDDHELPPDDETLIDDPSGVPEHRPGFGDHSTVAEYSDCPYCTPRE